MSALREPEVKTEFSIHPDTRMGYISLKVANLDNQIMFYQQAMGFKLHWREGNKAILGTGDKDLLHLTEEPNLNLPLPWGVCLR
jgi:catechol-2,3-dioxygenase